MRGVVRSQGAIGCSRGIGSVWESYADLGRRPRSGYVPLRFTSRDPQRAFQKPREKGKGVGRVCAYATSLEFERQAPAPSSRAMIA